MKNSEVVTVYYVNKSVEKVDILTFFKLKSKKLSQFLRILPENVDLF